MAEGLKRVSPYTTYIFSVLKLLHLVSQAWQTRLVHSFLQFFQVSRAVFIPGCEGKEGHEGKSVLISAFYDILHTHCTIQPAIASSSRATRGRKNIINQAGHNGDHE
jgi:hypothetical protein